MSGLLNANQSKLIDHFNQQCQQLLEQFSGHSDADLLFEQISDLHETLLRQLYGRNVKPAAGTD